jgi:hypothetical protein
VVVQIAAFSADLNVERELPGRLYSPQYVVIPSPNVARFECIGKEILMLPYLYLWFLNELSQIFAKHNVSSLVFYEENMFAVYYDELNDSLRYLSLCCLVVYELKETTVYQPILEGDEKVGRNWTFLEISGEIKPMSHYSTMILDKLVKKVRQSMGVF